MAEADFEELRALVAEEVARSRVPGFAVGLLCADEEHTAGFGVTNVDNPLPVDGDTLFQIGSITKTFAATAAMRLVEDGRLDLDAPVRTYLPELRLADAQDRLVGLDPPFTDTRAEVLRGADGVVEFIRFGGRIHQRAG